MKILDSLVEMVQLVHGLARKVARHDRDLAQQILGLLLATARSFAALGLRPRASWLRFC
ncbi:MAG TPA: hypothetical protein VI197_03950 [Polyangiaceae bacterium]